MNNFSIEEEISLIQTHVWHTKRAENRLRRKLSSIDSKMEESRKQLQEVIRLMDEKRNDINDHLEKLSVTENSLRAQLNRMCSKQKNINNPKYQRKHKKKLNSSLIMIVEQRIEYKDKLSTAECTQMLMQSLLSDESVPVDENEISPQLIAALDGNISPTVSEYVYYRKDMSRAQNELVQCCQQREQANQALMNSRLRLKRNMISMKMNECHHHQSCKCKCNHPNMILIEYEYDDDDYDINTMFQLPTALLSAVLLKLCEDIRHSGLIRTQKRSGLNYIRVFVASELVTWMVKSHIVQSRYESCILSAMLVESGFIYCTQSNHTMHNIVINHKKNKFIDHLSAFQNIRRHTNTNNNISSSSSSYMSNQLLIYNQSSSEKSVCLCTCNYCIRCKQPWSVKYIDCIDLYRFKCDDVRIERISKQGWLEKCGRFIDKNRYFIWDGVRRQLREYKTKEDIHHRQPCIYKYPMDAHSIITSIDDDCIELSFCDHGKSHTLRLKAKHKRDRDAWMRVLHKDLKGTFKEEDNEHKEEDVQNTFTDIHLQSNEAYEDFRRLRMKYRLKWSVVFATLSTMNAYIVSFRELILEQSNLSRCHRTVIEDKLKQLFIDPKSPIYQLFASFEELFLLPFTEISIDIIHVSSLNILITLCVNDIQSFLIHCQTRLLNLLSHPSLRNVIDGHEHQMHPVIKLMIKLLDKWCTVRCFTSEVYSTLFSMYQRVHHKVDVQLADIMADNLLCATAEYGISKDLQIDDEYHELQMCSQSITDTDSPFQNAISQLWQMSYCQTPASKVSCLVHMKDAVIQSIDEYRSLHRKDTEIMRIVEDDGHSDSGSNVHTTINDDNYSVESIESVSRSESQSKINVKSRKGKEVLIGTDDMIPLFSYILVQSKLKSVHAETAFMDDFTNEEDKQMRIGFYLTTLKAACSALIQKHLPNKKITTAV